MSDDPRNRGEPDRSRISLSEPRELKYWSNRYGVTPDQLIQAVHKVGAVPTQVESWLLEH